MRSLLHSSRKYPPRDGKDNGLLLPFWNLIPSPPMKSVLIALVLSALSLSSWADTAIYRIALNQTVFGNGSVQRVAAKGWLVHDTDNGAVTFVYGFKVGSLKFLAVRRFNGHRIDRVEGSKGSSYTVISFAANPSTEFAGVLMESLHLRGRNSTISLGSDGLLSLPRTYTMNARNVVKNTATGVTVSGETSGTATLDVNGSRASNITENYDGAVARFTSYFTGLGYTLVIPPPAN